MRSLSVGVAAAVALLCLAPVSVRSTYGNSISLSFVVDSAEAAELSIPARRRAGGGQYSRYNSARYSRLYDPYCGGPYVGGGFNGGTYYGGPWIDLRCFGNVY